MKQQPGKCGPVTNIPAVKTLVAFGRWLRRESVTLAGALWSFPVLAQAPAPSAVPVRPMYLEWGITIAMIGLAIFVVCRKSNRT